MNLQAHCAATKGIARPASYRKMWKARRALDEELFTREKFVYHRSMRAVGAAVIVLSFCRWGFDSFVRPDAQGY